MLRIWLLGVMFGWEVPSSSTALGSHSSSSPVRTSSAAVGGLPGRRAGPGSGLAGDVPGLLSLGALR
jgi:hypothetical protein